MRFLPLVPVVLVLVGCGSKMPSVLETPPPSSGPAIANGVALRPHYQFAGRQPIPAGTAFVVADRSGKPHMLTAAHVMDDDAEWGRVQGVSLRLMEGPPVASVQGRPLHIGKGFDTADAKADVVIWPLADGGNVAVLKLAAEDPKRNEWVWVIGQEPGYSGAQKVFRCKVTGLQTGGITMAPHDRFEMRGFSGGPVVNAKGEVVGMVLGGQASSMIIGPVSGLRERLAQSNVQLP